MILSLPKLSLIEYYILQSKTKKFLISDYNLDATLSSGQSFRWEKIGKDWEGVIGQQWIKLRSDHQYIIAETAIPQHNWEWLKKYLQLDFNLNQAIESFPDDRPIKNALNATPGLRLLRQDYWETLAAFILSATKQIVQIQQMVSLLSKRYGKQIVANGGSPVFAFPTIQAIADCTEKELRACKLGFRAPNLLAAARDILNNKINWQQIPLMDSTEAREELIKLRGVGQKIADCVLLFAGGHQHVFPIDVWIERALQRLYFAKSKPSSQKLRHFADNHFGPFAGLAQQYIFHHARIHLKLK